MSIATGSLAGSENALREEAVKSSSHLAHAYAADRSVPAAPSINELLSLQALKAAYEDDKENPMYLMIKKLESEELKYVAAAMTLLDQDSDFRYLMGGFSLRGVLNATNVVKQKAQETRLDDSLKRAFANLPGYDFLGNNVGFNPSNGYGGVSQAISETAAQANKIALDAKRKQQSSASSSSSTLYSSS